MKRIEVILTTQAGVKWLPKFEIPHLQIFNKQKPLVHYLPDLLITHSNLVRQVRFWSKKAFGLWPVSSLASHIKCHFRACCEFGMYLIKCLASLNVPCCTAHFWNQSLVTWYCLWVHFLLVTLKYQPSEVYLLSVYSFKKYRKRLTIISEKNQRIAKIISKFTL